jgi:uncharacterized protein (UPF0335 family)
MRVLGAILIVLGLLLSLTIFGAFFGIPMILIGIGLMVAGGRKTVITNVVQVSNAPSHLVYEPSLARGPDGRVDYRDRDYAGPVVSAPRAAPRIAAPGRPSVASRLESLEEAHRQFEDIENEISNEAIEILQAAKQSGFSVQYLRQSNRVVVKRQDSDPISLFSNDDIEAFGQSNGYP